MVLYDLRRKWCFVNSKNGAEPVGLPHGIMEVSTTGVEIAILL